MADETKTEGRGVTPVLFGRLPILTSIERFDVEDEGSILTEINEALNIHARNVEDMEYLYWYRRGITPTLARTKQVRPEILNKVNVAYAEEIVSFKNGYLLTKPLFYAARTDDEEITEKVKTLNEYLFRSGKQNADNEVVDWFHTVGKGDLFVRSNDDPEVPFVAEVLDPRSAFVAKSLAPGNRPVYGGYAVRVRDSVIISVWDDSHVITLEGVKTGEYPTPQPLITFEATRVLSIEPNPLKRIPIIEYYYNSVEMAAFEAALPLIDATSALQSDRLDGVDQAIQSLLVFYNCELEDENGNDIDPTTVRKDGALFLKSIGDNKADLKEIVTNLDQSQTQVFIDHLREQILSISSMPFAKDSGYHSAATGSAALIQNGWYQADTAARNTEDLFIKSNTQFDDIILHILREKNLLDLKTTDVRLQFANNETVNVQAKAQAFNTLLASGMHPQLAAQKSGISNDPVADMQMSEPYLKMIWGDPFAPQLDHTALPAPYEQPAQENNYAPNSPNVAPMANNEEDAGAPGMVASYTAIRNGRKVTISGYRRKAQMKPKDEQK